MSTAHLHRNQRVRLFYSTYSGVNLAAQEKTPIRDRGSREKFVSLNGLRVGCTIRSLLESNQSLVILMSYITSTEHPHDAYYNLGRAEVNPDCIHR